MKITDIFSRFKSPSVEPMHAKSTGNPNSFQLWANSIYYDATVDDNNIVNAIYHRFATDVSTASGQYYVNNTKATAEINNMIKLLRVKPNALDNPSSFLYLVAYNFISYGNSFVLINYDVNGSVQELLPLVPTQAIFLKNTDNGEMFYKFTFKDGTQHIFHQDFIAHLKNSNTGDQIGFGTNRSTLIKTTLDVIETNTQSLKNMMGYNGSITGVLGLDTALGEDHKKKALSNFTNYFKNSNIARVAVLGRNETFQAIEMKTNFLDETNNETLNGNVYKFFNINENIISGKYTEIEWGAYLQTHIDPFFTQLSQELTYKLIPASRIAKGHKIIFDTVKLKCSALTAKTSYYKMMLDTGTMSRNEVRALEDLTPIEGGDVYIVNAGGTGTNISDDPNNDTSKGGDNNE